MNIAVLYHNDADGFGAAYAVWAAFNHVADVVYLPVQYSQPVPELPETVERLFIVDFSYDRATCEQLAVKYGQENIVILDHHKTAEKDLAGLPFAIFDQEKSGAVLTWEYVCPGVRVPDILKYVQDRDLWKFELPESREINAYIATLPNEFEAWDSFDLTSALCCGRALIAFQDRQIRRAVRNMRLECFAGSTVPVVNLSDNVSEVGEQLCQQYPMYPFSVSYCDRSDGVRSYSLRSVVFAAFGR